MKKFVFTLLFLSFLCSNNFFSQLPPQGCGIASDEPPGCVFCGMYMGSTNGYTPDVTPHGFCGVVENNQWLSFVARDTLATITILTFSPCQNGRGVEMALFDLDLNLVSSCYSSGGINQSGGQITANNLTPGELYLLMIDGYEGDVCSFTLYSYGGLSLEFPLIDGSIASFPDITPVCRGTHVCYSVTPARNATHYNWYIPGATIISGQYTNEVCVIWQSVGSRLVNVTAANPCSEGPPLFFDVDIVSSVPPALQAINPAGIWFPGGAHGSIKLDYDTTQQLQFLWDTGDTTPEIENLIPGSYCVTVEGSDPCEVKGCFTVPGGIYKLSPFYILCRGISKRLNIHPQTGATFRWQPAAGLSCTDCPNPVASPRVTTTYTVTATLPNGYSEDYNVAVVVLPPSICDFAQSKEFDDRAEMDAFLKSVNYDFKQNNPEEESIRVFPNPVTDRVTIKSLKTPVTQIRMFDWSGKLIKTLHPNEAETEFSVENLNSGTYKLEISTGEFIFTRLLLKS